MLTIERSGKPDQTRVPARQEATRKAAQSRDRGWASASEPQSEGWNREHIKAVHHTPGSHMSRIEEARRLSSDTVGSR